MIEDIRFLSAVVASSCLVCLFLHICVEFGFIVLSESGGNFKICISFE